MNLKEKQDTSANAALAKQEELIQKVEKHLKKIDKLKLDINQREVRFEKRQQEYLKIIENLKVEIQKKSASRDFKSDEGQVQRQQLFNEINDNIDNIQLKISKILVDQEKDITKFFNNKIFEIKKQFEEERIKKGKKEQDYIEKENQLISELEWIKNIAQKIDDENHSLMDQYKKLKSDYQTQENDREMLFKELIMKKKKNAILKSQIEQYQEIYDEVSKEMDPEKDKNLKNESQYHNKSSKINQSRLNSAFNPNSLTNSQMKGIKQQHEEYNQRSQRTLQILYSNLQKEQKKVSKLKSMYVKELESQSELENIVRNIVDDLQMEVMYQNQKSTSKSKSGWKNQKKIDSNNKEFRAKIIESLLQNEKILTLIYDKTFYPLEEKNLSEISNNAD